MRVANDLMIDIETMSTEPNAAIVSIGACAFDPAGQDTVATLTDRFYCSVSLASCEKLGLHTSPDTISWWLKQSHDAQQALFTEPHLPIVMALTQFRKWAQDLKPLVNRIWANDPDFDYVILREAFKAAGHMWPWGFHVNRSCRTIKDLAWPENDAPDFRAGTTHHRADDDAAAQAVMVQAAYRKLVLGQ